MTGGSSPLPGNPGSVTVWVWRVVFSGPPYIGGSNRFSYYDRVGTRSESVYNLATCGFRTSIYSHHSSARIGILAYRHMRTQPAHATAQLHLRTSSRDQPASGRAHRMWLLCCDMVRQTPQPWVAHLTQSQQNRLCSGEALEASCRSHLSNKFPV